MRRKPLPDEPNEGIELLYTRDCKAWSETLTNLRAALAELKLTDEPRLVPVDTQDQAEFYQFFASPTIHINGIDIDPHARRISRRDLGVGRPYFYHGQTTPAPPTEMIVEGLRELYLS